MKNIFTSFLLCCICSITMAQNTSTLLVFSEDGLPFDLILNGVKQNENYETNIRIKGLEQPYYHATIIFKEKTLAAIEKKYLSVQNENGKNAEVTYIIKQNRKGEFKLKYYSAVLMESDSQYENDDAPRTVINDALCDDYYMSSIKFQESLNTISNEVHDSDKLNLAKEISNTHCLNSAQVEKIMLNFAHESTRLEFATHAYKRVFDKKNYYKVNNAFQFESSMDDLNEALGLTNSNTSTTSAATCKNYHISDNKFNQILQNINSKTHESSKLSLAKQISNSQCLSSEQIKKIMLDFTHESTRLEFAEHAYKRVFDKNNYYKVNDAFQIETSIDKLDEALELNQNTAQTTSANPCRYDRMPASEFDTALESINGKPHDSSKLNIARQISNSNCLTPIQIRKIMSAFAHESTRLEFAIHAYKRVFNKSNYYKVNDAFQIETSIDKLNEALGL